VLEWKV
jgi:hypothetical protein